jgi:hypothetical protein
MIMPISIDRIPLPYDRFSFSDGDILMQARVYCQFSGRAIDLVVWRSSPNLGLEGPLPFAPVALRESGLAHSSHRLAVLA